MELLQQYFKFGLGKKRTAYFFFFIYIKCYTEICLEKWSNKLPDFYFLRDKIEKHVELFMPGFSANEENFMEFLYGVRHAQENILKKNQKINM